MAAKIITINLLTNRFANDFTMLRDSQSCRSSLNALWLAWVQRPLVLCEELRELLGLEPVSLMIKKSRLRWFGHVERKDDNDWVRRCITWEVEGIRQRGRPKKTWWDCVKNDMESLGLSQNDAQSRNKWRRRIKGATG